ncbi:MAG: C-GCAxxG-C-C family protein [Muribaculaceae bacterium]|nr:C-GCAxxG-C-C family protein [Muribaculaceae bacterium]
MVKSRSEEVRERKICGRYNCAQAVAGAYPDVVGMDEETLNAVTSAFGTGMGTMEGTCGALVGAGVIIGLKINDRIRSRELMKEIMTDFKQANGSTVCRALKGIDTGKPLRDCPGCCADAARLLEKKLESLQSEL